MFFKALDIAAMASLIFAIASWRVCPEKYSPEESDIRHELAVFILLDNDSVDMKKIIAGETIVSNQRIRRSPIDCRAGWEIGIGPCWIRSAGKSISSPSRRV